MRPHEDTGNRNSGDGTDATEEVREDESTVEGPKPGSPDRRALEREANQQAEENVDGDADQ